jgi:protein-disulfide isomerase
VNRKQLLVGLVLVAVAAMGVAAWFVFFGAGPSDTDALPAAGAGQRLSIQLTASDRRLGSPKAPVLMVEYASPQCPFCARFDMDLFPH